MKSMLTFLTCAALFAFTSSALAAGGDKLKMPACTKRDAAPRKAKYDWNLTPTGLRGPMLCDEMVTTDARRISITKVEKGSPADGLLAAGDVLLGAGGNPIKHYGELDLEMSRKKLDQAGATKQSMA